MTQRNDRLDVVVRIRGIAERRAQAAAARAALGVAAAEETLQRRHADYAARPVATAPATVDDLQVVRLAGVGALDRIQVAAGERDDAEAARQRALTTLRTAAVQLASAEQLVARRAEAAAKAAARAAERSLEELVLLQRSSTCR